MDDFTLIQSFFNKKCKNVPYQVWIQQSQDNHYQLTYRQGECELTPPPLLSFPNGNSKYTITQHKNNVYFAFSYPDEYRVVVGMLHETCLLKEDELEHLFLLFYLSYSQQIILTKESELDIWIESIRKTTSSLDLDELLTNIVSNALTFIPVMDAGYLQLYDPETELLVPKAAVGFNENIHSFRVKIGEAITGHVFQEGKPIMFGRKEEIYQAMSTMSKGNYYHLHAAVDKTSYLKALISVPVSMGEKRIGVMTVHQFNKEGKLTNRDLHLLQGFAAQAAIAIHNAQLYSELKMRFEEVSELSEQLMAKNQFLLKRNDIHKTLTQLSLQNKGTETIILELNRMMDRTVSFMDFLNMEYYSKKQILQHPPFSMEEIAKIFSQRKKPVYVDLSDQTSHYLYPIYSGTVFLGCFIVPMTRPLSQLDQITIEQGGGILALELVKKQTLTEVYYKKTHEFFNELLQNKDPQLLLAKGKELGINLSAFLSVAIFEITAYQDLQTLEANIHRLSSILKKGLLTVDMLVFGFNNKVTLLISLKNPSLITEITRLFRSILAEWESSEGPPLSVGISTPHEGLEHISKSYDEASKTLVYLANRNRTGLMRYEEIGLNRLFLNQPTQEIQHFLHEILSPLWTEKAKSNHLEQTLITYIASNRSATQTAEKLHIHINTFYQRLKKIEELLNLNFNEPDDFLTILLACHLQESFHHTPTSVDT
ncbi:helix-turn-helix domain-containing protein [Ammoniphilus sp. YIM 78166]|uniref:helix-turn-helix domain-containing protein n=1 Tax=Ammoniphilus sp. YIM 78166 TaxID=1644106 RepID=UPI00106FE400|nr:helix-turn-helix domain-containing protein [Ammoniphilus sp. YIM 78166]